MEDERQAARDRFVEERKRTSLADRVDAGIALDSLSLDEEAPVPESARCSGFAQAAAPISATFGSVPATQ